MKVDELYAFLYNPKQNEVERSEGWAVMDLAADFKRMGLPNDHWETTELNKDYEVASSSFCILHHSL